MKLTKEAIEKILSEGRAIKCNTDGNYLVGDKPYNKNPRYTEAEIDSVDFDDVLEEQFPNIRSKSTGDGCQTWVMAKK